MVILELESEHKGGNIQSIRSVVVDGKMMRPNYWMKSVLFVSFSDLTLSV